MITLNLLPVLSKKVISQRQLAKGTGVRLATINEMCKNQSKHISIANLDRICDYLEVTPGELILHSKKAPE